jgi:hypothetical protein
MSLNSGLACFGNVSCVFEKPILGLFIRGPANWEIGPVFARHEVAIYTLLSNSFEGNTG